jgi:hypothetical protein
MKYFHIILILLFSINSAIGQKKDSVTYKSDLSWSDFKGKPIVESEKMGVLSCTIQMKTEKVNVWTGVTTLKTWSVFYPSDSWIKENSKTEQMLTYFQGILNICEIYARKLSKEINLKKINGSNKAKMTKIFQDFDKLNIQEQEKYGIETNFGKNNEQLKIWTEKLKSELTQLN